MSEPKSPLWRHAVSVLGTLGIIALSVALILAGRGVLADRSAAASGPDPAAVTPVSTDRIAMTDHYEVTRRFSGQFEARQETALAFERAGTIAEVLVRDGDAVTRGQPIARLDTRLLEAEAKRLTAQRAGLEAQAELARRTNARQAELRERGHASDQRVDDTSLALAQLEAGIAEIDAALTSTQVNLGKSVLTAPFTGTIGARLVDAGTIAAPGSPVATLLQDGAPRFRAGLDPALAEALTLGDPVEITLGTGTRTATLAHLSPELDTMTRARTALFDVDGPAPPSRATGEVALTQRIEATGAWIPLSALRQGPRGTWILLTVEDGAVATEAAEILHVQGARAFIRGTFTDGTEFITGGTHRVVPGQPVTAEEALAWAR